MQPFFFVFLFISKYSHIYNKGYGNFLHFKADKDTIYTDLSNYNMWFVILIFFFKMLFYYIHVHLKHTIKNDDREINFKRYERYLRYKPAISTYLVYFLTTETYRKCFLPFFRPSIIIFFKKIGNKKIVYFDFYIQ